MRKSIRNLGMKGLVSTLLAVSLVFSQIPMLGNIGGEKKLYASSDDEYDDYDDDDGDDDGDDDYSDSSKTLSYTVGNSTYSYEVNDDGETVTITDYEGTDTEIEIPSEIDGKIVTDIGNYAFIYCEATNIVIPDGVINILDKAFLCCNNMEKLVIPESVINIELWAFSACTGITSIVVDEKNEMYDSREDCNAIIKSETNELIYGCSTTKLVNGITGIEDGALVYSNITDVDIPASCIDIGKDALPERWRVTSITVDEDNEVYDSRDNCNAIIKIETNELIYGCSNTVIPNSVVSIGDSAFRYSGISSIEIPEGVTSIGAFAFAECFSLESIIIPESVTYIDLNAFGGFGGSSLIVYGCSGSTAESYVYGRGYSSNFSICFVDSNLCYIAGNSKYYYLINSDEETVTITYYEGTDTEIEIPSEIDGKMVTSIGKGVFQNSSGITSIKIPDSVISIWDSAFRWCEELESIEISENVISIGAYAFEGCNEDLTIYGYTGSVAETYANDNDINFVSIGVIDETGDETGEGTGDTKKDDSGEGTDDTKKGDSGDSTSDTKKDDGDGKLDTDDQDQKQGQVGLNYKTHVQSYGWQDYVTDGETSGTVGKAKRLEAIQIKLVDSDGNDFDSSRGGIEYSTHVQKYGWMDYVADDEMSGTSGETKRLEAIKIRLTGDVADEYDVYYRVQAQKFGWLGWAKNDEEAGTAGYGYRLEAIQIKLVEKDGEAPSNVTENTKNLNAFYDKNEIPVLNYRTHVQTYGWQDYVTSGNMSGTEGKAKRLEGIKIKIAENNTGIEGEIKYRTHVQKYGWMDYLADDEMSGTSGEAKRLEAIQVELTGDLADYFDVYYRVHAQRFGWMGWAKNGEEAGTAGYGYRLEGIQIQLVYKDTPAPGSTDGAYKSK